VEAFFSQSLSGFRFKTRSEALRLLRQLHADPCLQKSAFGFEGILTNENSSFPYEDHDSYDTNAVFNVLFNPMRLILKF
jgi:hypothetical protein